MGADLGSGHSFSIPGNFKFDMSANTGWSRMYDPWSDAHIGAVADTTNNPGLKELQLKLDKYEARLEIRVIPAYLCCYSICVPGTNILSFQFTVLPQECPRPSGQG